MMRQFGPGSAVSSKVNLSAEIVSWSPCLVKHFIKIIIHYRCMLTGRRDMPTELFLMMLSEQQQQQLKE